MILDIFFFLRGTNFIINNIYFIQVKSYIFNKFFFLNNFRKYILKKYIYTINHKRIAINYFYFSMITGLSGAALATMIRLELSHPGSPFFKGDALRYLQVITAHGLIMVFFVVVPLLFGGFANFLIPYHVGSKDVAYPRLNSIGFWIQPCGFILLAKIGFLRPQFWRYYDKTAFSFNLLEKLKFYKTKPFNNDMLLYVNYLKDTTINNNYIIWKVRKNLSDLSYDNFNFTPIKLFFWNNIINYPESFWYASSRVLKSRRKKIFVSKCSARTLVTAGWTFITPFSSNLKYTGVGSQDILILSVIFAGVSTTISFTNLLITRRTLSMPGIRHRRVLLPFISIGLFLALRMLAIITPVLAAAMIMMILDRHWQTTFFEYAYGGDPILSQHLFWFFGHPEVYVLIIPTFGFINMIIPHNNTRRVASKHHMIWAIYVMSYMGFLVWGHHMYLVGLDHRSRTMYSTITIMISMPATIKVVNWTLSLVNGALKIDLPLLFSFSFLFLFLVAGFTGMWLSHVSLNVSMHDTFYVVAHFHIMLSGSAMVGIFSGFYYYFNALFGIKYSRIFGYLHLLYYSGGQWITFTPQFYLGFSGMPRRIHDYPVVFMGWQSMSTTGHFITLIGIIFFFAMLLDSHIERRLHTSSTLGLPRWYKRINYYLFKIRLIQFNSSRLKFLPNYKTRLSIFSIYHNEVEIYKN
uniref:Cytochrome c oxidase subunit 1 n=6 Tax=Ichthyophthirius multifiliis TaxID=5932 RepID=G1FLE2_ICHMU|nr:cytochrome c oxidase subunit 1 [Ichthyophthirius multifiliis]AEL89284.1 cytochrome c oxidase subunit 1 [Ichthyophthirius multifiliis]